VLNQDAEMVIAEAIAHNVATGHTCHFQGECRLEGK
jgi:hypothetical protein